MTDLSIRPKSDYLHTADWQQLYVLTEHWQKDMEFYKDELRFLYKLVDKYFIWLVDDEHIRMVQNIVNEIRLDERKGNEIREAIKLHLRHLESLMQNAFSQDEQKFRDEHSELEDALAQYAKDFRDIKKTVFQATELVMESEKLGHLLER